MNIWRVSLTVQSGFCTTGEKIGSFVDCLRDIHEIPFIPATHIKGIMRCEAERILRADPSSKSRNCSIFGERFDDKNSSADGKPQLCGEVLQKNGNFGCDICSLFGSPNVADTTKTGAGSIYQEGIIRVTDFHLDNPRIKDRGTDRRPHVAINRASQTKEPRHLFSGNVVPGSQIFQGFIILRRSLTESERKLLEASLRSMAHYGIGGNRSRGLGAVSINVDTNCMLNDFQNAVNNRFGALQAIRNEEE
jgi:CRISPR/Cas system CSM-associated protein Csm3 (group 7 of RAMP superfamily)